MTRSPFSCLRVTSPLRGGVANVSKLLDDNESDEDERDEDEREAN